MAERTLSLAIGDALIALIDWAWPRVGHKVEEWVEGIADAVRPDPPMAIRTLDGLVLTGLIVADRGQVILFVGTRIPPPNGFPSHLDPRSSRYEDGSIPLWAREDPRDPRDMGPRHDPYRR